MYQQMKADDDLKDIPVIVLSGVDTKTFFHSLNVLGTGSNEPLPEPDAYIEKPPNPEELLERVQGLLKKSKANDLEP
jgi:DNA-binding response OmpR family regulator